MVRFIADAMLGDVARWLRMLGYDTLYSRSFKDYEILRLAEKEDRVILTRDVGLARRARRKGLRAILIDPLEEITDILVRIAIRANIDLKFKESETRCPYCNTRLIMISKAEALSLVPPSIGAKYDKFWKCPRCGRIYWQGNHWKTINEILSNANKKLINLRATHFKSKGGSSESGGFRS